MRRGGFGDSGSVSGTGELPRAEHVAVLSEEQLRQELDAVASSLVPSADWTQRVEALLRLEGLVLGGAAQYAGFAEGLTAVVREPLVSQVLERRSAVSRQACHVLSVLAEACGDRLEALAVQLLPVLLKATAMGIQVVTESADACARTLLRYCHATKVLPRLCSTVGKDRNAKLRQCASNYLLQILEEWDPSLFEKHLEDVEGAILAAAQDAQSDTRAAGRLMYAVFASTWPAQANSMLRRVERDKHLQEKLLQAVEGYKPGALSAESSGSLAQHTPGKQFGHPGMQPSSPRGGARPGPVQGPALMATVQRTAPRQLPVVPRLALSSLTTSGSSSPSVPSSARLPALPSGITPRVMRQPAATARAPRVDMLHEGENQRPNTAGSANSTPRAMMAKPARTAATTGLRGDGPARGRLGARKSMGGAAMRINIAALTQEQDGEEASEEYKRPTASMRMTARARRQSALPPIPLRAEIPLARRVEADQSCTPDGSELGELAPSVSYDDRQPAQSLMQVVAQVSKAGTAWVDKVQLFGLLGELLQGPGCTPHADVAANAERVAACLLDGVGDAHFKVAAAALEALAAGLAGRNCKTFEPQLHRIMPALFLRAVDAKEQLKSLAAAALAEVPRHAHPDTVLAALARSLQLSRAPKAKCAVLDFFTAEATGGVELEDKLELGPPGGSSPALRTLVAATLPLATDKNPDIRRSALAALRVVYHAGQDSVVVAAVLALPPAAGLAAQKALAPALPHLEEDMAAAMRASRPAPVAGAGSAAAPTVASRRHSGEGLPQLRLPEPVLTLLGPKAASKPPLPSVLPSRGVSAAATPQVGSPRSASPKRWYAGDTSPAPVSPSTSRLGRPALPPLPDVEPQLSRHASSCITHTSSPLASTSSLSRSPSVPSIGAAAAPAAAMAGAAALARHPSPLGRPFCPSSEAVDPDASLSCSAQQEQQQQQQLTPPPAAAGELQELGDTAGQQAGAAAAPDVPAAPSLSELAPFDSIMEGQLRRLVAQLQDGPTPEAFQGLSRLAHVLPLTAWVPHFDQVLSAVLSALGAGGSPLVKEGGLKLVQDLASVQPELFAEPLPQLLPLLLDCMADSNREVVVAADDALAQLLGALPPQPSLEILMQRLPGAARGACLTSDPAEGAVLYAGLKGLRRTVARLAAVAQGILQAEELLPRLVPGLCTSYCSPIADVRKATVDCLVALWLVVGGALEPHLAQLSASQMKLLLIYRDKALAQQRAS